MRLGRASAAAFAAALVAAAPASAGTWSAPEWLTQQPTAEPRIAGNERGDAVVAWRTEHEVLAARREAGGRFHPPVVLASGKSERLRVFEAAMDERGDAFVGVFYSWKGTARVAIARRGERFRRPETVSVPGDGTWTADLAVGPAGDAVVVWQAGDFLEASVGGARNGFGPARVIGPGNYVLPAVSAGGDPLLVESRQGHERKFLVGRRGDRDGVFGPRYELASFTDTDPWSLFNELAFEAGPGGGGIATWTGRYQADPQCCHQSLFASTWKRDGRAVATQNLGVVPYSTVPSLAANEAGRALVVWPAPHEMRVAERRPRHPFLFAPALPVGPYCCAESNAFSIDLNRLGAAVFGWQSGNPSKHELGARVALRSPDGTFQPIRRFGLNLATWTDYDPGPAASAVTIDGKGRATVLLSQDEIYALAVATYRP